MMLSKAPPVWYAAEPCVASSWLMWAGLEHLVEDGSVRFNVSWDMEGEDWKLRSFKVLPAAVKEARIYLPEAQEDGGEQTRWAEPRSVSEDGMVIGGSR